MSSLLLPFFLACCTPGPARVERTVYAMGTELRVAVEATDRPAALAASERAVRAVEAAEQRLSTWDRETELARLNRAAVGERVRLSPALAADLRAARWCREATAGAFDPAVGALVAAWGLREGGRSPSAAELRRALAATGAGALRLHGRVAVRRRAGVALEEGGFGKGAGLADALAALAGDSRVRRAELDFGGQLAVTGEGAPWLFAVADPRDRGRPVAAVAVDGGSLATSGTSERGAHLLDPRSGRPARDFGSLTVWTADPLRADCLSTGLYVLGPEGALAWAGRRSGVEVLVVEKKDGGRLLGRLTPGLAERLRPLAPELEVEIWNAGGVPAKPGSRASP